MSDSKITLPKKQSLTLRVERARALNPQTALLTLGAEPALAAACVPGQFFNLRPLKSSAPLLRRPISVCDARPDSGEIDFLIRKTGEGTELLAARLAGDSVEALGPLGNPFAPNPEKPLLLIAGGVGVAPLHFLAKWARRAAAADSHPEIAFCYGARSAADHVLLDSLRAVVADLALATEDGSAGEKGFVTALLDSRLASEKEICVCGPAAMMNAVLGELRKRGLSAQLSLENRMGCGVGACQGCVVPGRRGMIRVCCDGPVVSSEDIDQIFTE